MSESPRYRWPALMSMRDACEYLSLGETSVKALVATKQLRVVTVGTKRIFRRDDLDDFIRDLKYVPPNRRAPVGVLKESN